LYKNKLKETTQKTTKEKIVELLTLNNKLTRDDLSNEIGITPDAIKQHLANLQKEKRLTRVGRRKDGYGKVLKIND